MSGLGRAFSLFTGASMIGSFTQVIKGKLTAVFLGAEGIGVLSQLTNLWSLFSVIASLGLYNGMVRHLSPAWQDQDRTAFKRHMSSNTLLLMVSGLIIPLIGCIYSSQLSHLVFDDFGSRSNLVCLILVSIPVYIASQIYRSLLNAAKSVDNLVRARIFADVLSVLVLAALIYPLGLKGAIIGYIGLHVLYLAFTAYYVWRFLGPEIAKPDPHLFNTADIYKNIGYGINGLIAVSVGIITTLIISRWIIAEGGAAENGLFAMALKIATVYLGGLSAAAGGYYFPVLASAKSNDEIQAHVNDTLSMYMFVVPPIIVFLVTGGELMMSILFSPEFIPAAILLLLILPGDLFRITAETVGMPLLIRKHFILSTGSYVVWALFYLSIAFLLLLNFGIFGVALAYLISQAFNAAIKIFLVKHTLSLNINRQTGYSIVRGFLLVFASVLAVSSVKSEIFHWIAALSLVLVWGVASRSNLQFVALSNKFLSKLGWQRKE